MNGYPTFYPRIALVAPSPGRQSQTRSAGPCLSWHKGEAMYISLIGFQWTSTEIKIFNSLIIPHLIMITCISYGNTFAILVPTYINIASL